MGNDVLVVSFDCGNEIDIPRLYNELLGTNKKTKGVKIMKRVLKVKSWADKEIELACNSKSITANISYPIYSKECYDSALKAYKSLTNDGHEGGAIVILGRLLEGKPLTPIYDTPDMWKNVSGDREDGGEEIEYQCKRMGSLLKKVHTDGPVTYSDMNRSICVDIRNHQTCYFTWINREIVDKMFPITMPYYPEEKFSIYYEDILTDHDNGSFDTIAIYYAIAPNQEKISINRFFKENGDHWDEIDFLEYRLRVNAANKLFEEDKQQFYASTRIQEATLRY